MTSTNPADRVPAVHALLVTELGIDSPLTEAVRMLDNAARLTFARQRGASRAQTLRAKLAREVAEGRRPFDDAAVREFAQGDVWTNAVESYNTPAATVLAEQVQHQAKAAAGGQLTAHASGIFDLLAAEAAKVVKTLASLPDPPAGLFTSGGDPAQLLVRSPGHAETYSVLLKANDRFWTIQRGADAVRDLAGFGPERLPDGAPRLAFAYRNWRKAMEQKPALRTTVRHLRLWRCVIDGW